jgi:glycosyltransferase involved in cell wall biosynthesis
MLLDPVKGFRTNFAAWAPGALLSAKPNGAPSGLPYVNVSHTDFDLPRHWNWIKQSDLRGVYFVHDLIPILHPQFSRPHAVNRHLGRVRGALKCADLIVVSSNMVASDLRAFARSESLPVPPIAIAPIAGEAFEPTHQPKRQRQPLSPHPRPYFLCAGTIEPRKNHRFLLDVWRKLASNMGAKTPRLIIAGQAGPLTGDILAPLKTEPALTASTEWREDCSDGELANLMGNASALLMPSLAEGYGLPIVEALRLGTPVIARDGAIFREIGQGIPDLIDQNDADTWAAKIAEHAATPANAQAKAARAARFNAPTWGDHFRKVDAQIASLALKTGSACESSLAA